MPNTTVFATDEDAELRPKTLDAFLGQDHIKAALNLAVYSARLRGVQLDHVLFHGPAGTGKTTLARIIAAQMGRNFYELMGPAITKIGNLSQKLTDLDDGDVLFIDEIHRIPREVQEMLYPAMEDFKAICPVKIGGEVKEFGVKLARFTLVGATTAKGMLSDSMLERFGMDFGLQFYDEVSLASIAKRSAALLSMPLTDDAAMEIARRAKGTPRIANRLVLRVLDYFTVYGLRVATQEAVEDAMGMIRIDEHGFDDIDRLYLSTLLKIHGGGPAGAGAIAASIQQEECTLVDSVEPYLQRIELLRRTGRGRELTTRGREVAREVS